MTECCKQCKRNQKTLFHLISWVAQSAASPISHSDAEKLFDMLSVPSVCGEEKDGLYLSHP